MDYANPDELWIQGLDSDQGRPQFWPPVADFERLNSYLLSQGAQDITNSRGKKTRKFFCLKGSFRCHGRGLWKYELICSFIHRFIHFWIESLEKVLYLACIPWAWWPLRHTRFCRPSSLSRFGRLESYIQYIRRRKFLVFDHWYRVRPPEIWEIPKFQTKIAAT